jgi:hypothetical protein
VKRPVSTAINRPFTGVAAHHRRSRSRLRWPLVVPRYPFAWSPSRGRRASGPGEAIWLILPLVVPTKGQCGSGPGRTDEVDSLLCLSPSARCVSAACRAERKTRRWGCNGGRFSGMKSDPETARGQDRRPPYSRTTRNCKSGDGTPSPRLLIWELAHR